MAVNDPESGKKLDIRKYPNRRYYDATRSRHITLEAIHALVRDGYDIQVTDAKTGVDITGKILTQIMLERDSPKLDVFPAALLHRLIRANEQIVHDFLDKYFNQALMSFFDSQRQFETYLRQTLGLQMPLPSVADWTRLMMGPFGKLWAGTAPTPGEPGRPGPETENSNLQAVVEDLKQQVQTLQKKLAGRKKRRSRPSHR